MVAVSVTPMELDEIAPKEEKIKEVRTTVASLRLDAVASSGFSVSRTKLVSAVNAGLLQVNWQPAKGPSQEVKEGDDHLYAWSWPNEGRGYYGHIP